MSTDSAAKSGPNATAEDVMSAARATQTLENRQAEDDSGDAGYASSAVCSGLTTLSNRQGFQGTRSGGRRQKAKRFLSARRGELGRAWSASDGHSRFGYAEEGLGGEDCAGDVQGSWRW